jgi:hypothetical protein
MMNHFGAAKMFSKFLKPEYKENIAFRMIFQRAFLAQMPLEIDSSTKNGSKVIIDPKLLR